MFQKLRPIRRLLRMSRHPLPRLNQLSLRLIPQLPRLNQLSLRLIPTLPWLIQLPIQQFL